MFPEMKMMCHKAKQMDQTDHFETSQKQKQILDNRTDSSDNIRPS